MDLRSRYKQELDLMQDDLHNATNLDNGLFNQVSGVNGRLAEIHHLAVSVLPTMEMDAASALLAHKKRELLVELTKGKTLVAAFIKLLHDMQTRADRMNQLVDEFPIEEEAHARNTVNVMLSCLDAIKKNVVTVMNELVEVEDQYEDAEWAEVEEEEEEEEVDEEEEEDEEVDGAEEVDEAEEVNGTEEEDGTEEDDGTEDDDGTEEEDEQEGEWEEEVETSEDVCEDEHVMGL